MVLVLLLGGCATGTQSDPPDGSSSDTHHERDITDPVPETTSDLPRVLDHDGDGHCAPGTDDPDGLCISLLDCDDGDKTRYPGALEDCANTGVDNDCDQDADEVDLDQDGSTDIGQACHTGFPGVCDDGTRQCQGSSFTCAATIQIEQQPETCNGTDDNCDGKTDEGPLCTAGNICSGSGGCTCNGGTPCTGGSTCCSGVGCVDLALSTSSCGACGVACGATESCDGGKCRCGSTLGTTGSGPACAGGASCNGTTCVVCDPLVNLAPAATASSSGGGSMAGYEPAQLNNNLLESSCKFHWITASSTPGSAWLQLIWSAPVTLSQVWFDTVPASTSVCGTSTGRTLAGGTLQYWDGGAWVNLVAVAGKSNDWTQSVPKVSTTRLRLYGAHATTAGYAQNPMIFEWRVFCQ